MLSGKIVTGSQQKRVWLIKAAERLTILLRLEFPLAPGEAGIRVVSRVGVVGAQIDGLAEGVDSLHGEAVKTRSDQSGASRIEVAARAVQDIADFGQIGSARRALMVAVV